MIICHGSDVKMPKLFARTLCTNLVLESASLTPQVLLQASLRRLQRESVELYQVGIIYLNMQHSN